MENQQEKVYLSREAILVAQDQQLGEIYIPEWKTWVRVRGMTVGERDKFESEMIKGRGKGAQVNVTQARSRMVSRCLINQDGSRMFSEADIPAIAKKSAAAIERIFDEARRLSGMTEGDVEELAGNSESDQNEDSSSD